MAKQSGATKNKKILDRIDAFRLTHKTLFIVLVVGTFVLVFGGLLKFGLYQNKFSDKDYAAIEAAAEGIFKNIGGDIKRYEYCSYEAPEKYSSVKLYCAVNVVAYMPYESDEQAARMAKYLEAEIKKLGSSISHMSEFYEKPADNLTGASVILAPPFPRHQCHFTIASHSKAKDISSVFPERDEDNLIALQFNCSAESREEYFPVIYRQGE